MTYVYRCRVCSTVWVERDDTVGDRCPTCDRIIPIRGSYVTGTEWFFAEPDRSLSISGVES